MNNDDIFSDTDPRNNLPALSPELEVRVVAWVLGEASVDEATELTRLAAENPALAEFKRRIETIHGLTGAASRPVADATLRLSDERRAKLLAVIGETSAGQGDGGATHAQGGANPTRRWVMAWNKWALPMAACITLCALLGAVLFPDIGGAKRPKRPTPSMTLLGPGPSGSVGQPTMIRELQAGASEEAPMVTFAPAPLAAIESRRGQFLAADKLGEADGAVAATTMPVPTAAPVPASAVGSGIATLTGHNTYTGGTGIASGSTAIAAAPVDAFAAKDQGTALGDAADTISAGRAAAKAAPKAPRAVAGVDLESTKSVTVLSGLRSEIMITAGTLQKFEESNPAITGPVSISNTSKDSDGKAQSQLWVRDVGSLQQPLAYNEEKRAAGEKDKNLEDAPLAHKSLLPAFDESLRTETATSQQAVSTFSLHVSDASFRIAKAALSRGEAPEPASIRPEEFYNAFDYGDPSAVAGEPVACRIEQSAHPFLQQRNLVRIAMKVPATGRGAGQPLRLTVLLDTSGSMEREDRAAVVRTALTSLVSLLGVDDRIKLIGFARQPHLLADRVPGNQAAGLADLVAKTPFEGGTNLEEALKLAGNLARGQFTASAQNRIVLLTDGAANLGNDDPAQLAAMIAALRQQGIAFDACGVGADGLDDTILEALTRKGDGRYTVLNSPEEADAGFARKLAGAFRPAAENVKLQVRFNPSRVARYRLIGFEQHRLKTEDFRNDRVDAAELAAEEAAVALYQIEVIPDGEGELGEVSVRFRETATGNMVERSWTLAYAPQPPAFVRAAPSMKLAGTAAFLAEKLRGGDLAAQIRLDELAPVVNALRSDYAHDARVQDLVTMFAQTRRLMGE